MNRKVLQVLERDGRVSNAELAARIGLSPSACLRRVQELERSGAILGYRTVLERARAVRGFLAFVTLNVSGHSKASLAAFERGVAAAPKVRECHNVTGGVDDIYAWWSHLADCRRVHTDKLDTPRASSRSRCSSSWTVRRTTAVDPTACRDVIGSVFNHIEIKGFYRLSFRIVFKVCE